VHISQGSPLNDDSIVHVSSVIRDCKQRFDAIVTDECRFNVELDYNANKLDCHCPQLCVSVYITWLARSFIVCTRQPSQIIKHSFCRYYKMH